MVPRMLTQHKAQEFADWLNAKLIYTTISGSLVVGALVCANSNGMVLPNTIHEKELTDIQNVFDGTITIMETKKNAYGNLILANDKGAIADPRLKETDLKKIAETLNVEVLQTEIAGLPYVGSLASATNKGVLAHPLLKEKERKIIEQALKVPVDVGTINCGIPYVGTGLIANSHNAIAGSVTTGPEMFIIGNALDVVQEVE
jgi:translation initiation factor 6